MQHSPQRDRLIEDAEKLRLQHKHEEAIDLLESFLLSSPDDAEILEEIADNELSLHRYDRAEKAATHAVSLDSESALGYYILGFLSSIREQWPKAVEHLKRSNFLQPNDPEILRCLGWALFQSGEKTIGLVTLERALNLDGDNTLILCDLGSVHIALRNVLKAKALLRRSLDLDPKNARALETLKVAEKI